MNKPDKAGASAPSHPKSGDQPPPKKGGGEDNLVLQVRNIRYLLERRLRKMVEVLVRSSVGQTPPCFIIVLDPSKENSFQPSPRDNSYCRLVYATKDGRDRCAKCYLTHLAEAGNQREPFAYICHAGLTNVLVPIRVREKTIGGFLVGRVLPENLSTDQKRKLAAFKRHFRKPEALDAALKDVVVVTEPDLQFAALVARNLVESEAPMLLEPQVFNPPVDPPKPEKKPAPRQTQDASGPPKKSYHQLRICQQVIDIMNAQFASPLTVTLLAEAVNRTPNYLSFMFHKTIGSTLGDYLTRVRIKKAQGYLQRADVNIKEVAHRVGFTDSNHFSVAFKKLTGLTPSEWRTKMDEKRLVAPSLSELEDEPPLTDRPS